MVRKYKTKEEKQKGKPEPDIRTKKELRIVSWKSYMKR